jgi:hypothetical protein
MKEHSIIKLGGGHFTCSKCGKTVFGSTKHRCNMIPESKLKADCTPEIIKKMVELAEGFEIDDSNIVYCGGMLTIELKKYFNFIVFPLLIHRAVEGWNKKLYESIILVQHNHLTKKESRYNFNDYQPESLTPCECACLHCLIEVLG